MKKKFWTTFLIALIAFSAIFAGVGKYIFNDDAAISAGEDDEIEKELEDIDEIVVLLMGVDDNDYEGGVEKTKRMKIEGENRHKQTGLRTDTMMLGKYNLETGDITLLSIPRDTRTTIRGRKNPETINHAYNYEGPYLSMETVSDLLNVEVNYYITVDYLAVKTMVDAIGGVPIDVPVKMRHPDPYIHLDPGMQTLNGDESLMYLRFRSYKLGDVGRVQAQQKLMIEIIQQALSVENAPKLGSFIKTYMNRVDTNIPLKKVVELIPIAGKMDTEHIDTYTIPGEAGYEGDISYYFYYEDATQTLVDELLYDYKLDNDINESME